MRAVAILPLLVLALAGTGGEARSAEGASEGAGACYANARWWTPEGFEPGRRCVRAGRFVAPSDVAEAAETDLGGAWVVPPFGEAHNHNLDNPGMAPGDERRLSVGRRPLCEEPELAGRVDGRRARGVERAIFPDRRIGRLEPGYEIRFVVLPADPVADMTQPFQVRAVYKQGAVAWERR